VNCELGVTVAGVPPLVLGPNSAVETTFAGTFASELLGWQVLFAGVI
jgi:hypothetical protein